MVLVIMSHVQGAAGLVNGGKRTFRDLGSPPLPPHPQLMAEGKNQRQKLLNQ